MGGLDSVGARLARIEALIWSQTNAPTMLFVKPQQWPAEDQAAYWSGDDDALADAVERHTGERPGPQTVIVAFIYVRKPLPGEERR